MAGSIEEARVWLNKGERSLEVGRVLLAQGFYPEALSRAYYAMFYAAKAALTLEGVHVRKHSSVISAFGRCFAKTGRVPSRLHVALREALDDRHEADYALISDISREEAERRMEEANEFISQARGLLEQA